MIAFEQKKNSYQKLYFVQLDDMATAFQIIDSETFIISVKNGCVMMWTVQEKRFFLRNFVQSDLIKDPNCMLYIDKYLYVGTESNGISRIGLDLSNFLMIEDWSYNQMSSHSITDMLLIRPQTLLILAQNAELYCLQLMQGHKRGGSEMEKGNSKGSGMSKADGKKDGAI